MHISNKHIYVGLSLIRSQYLSHPGPTCGTIAILERETLKQLGSVRLPFAEVYDIIAVND